MSLLRKAVTRAAIQAVALSSRRPISQTIVRRGGDHHGPMMPPFARNAPPTTTVLEIFF